MNIAEARTYFVKEIKNIYDEGEANNMYEWAIENITALSRMERIRNRNYSLSFEQQTALQNIIRRLQQHEPIQYILNESWFAGMKLYVDKNVLIPRPETEELVEWVVNEARNRKQGTRIIDIGTGSGCIAIALKIKLPGAEVWACDVSDEALTIARKNADDNNALIDFVPLDFLDSSQRKQLPFADVIISNPPYVPLGDKNEMKKNVTDFEPHLALFVQDKDPLIFYKALADFGKENLHPAGAIYAEIHENLGDGVQNIFTSKNYSSVEIKKDLQGKNRMVRVKI